MPRCRAQPQLAKARRALFRGAQAGRTKDSWPPAVRAAIFFNLLMRPFWTGGAFLNVLFLFPFFFYLSYVPFLVWQSCSDQAAFVLC